VRFPAAGAPLLLALLVAAVMLAGASMARADTSSEYHEVTRFGRYDEAALSGGTLTAGQFVEPTGFAVDAQEGNAVYVADRTSSVKGIETPSKTETRAHWRIQKLSADGSVLATTTFTLPSEKITEETIKKTPFGPSEKIIKHEALPSVVAGLAVDHRAGRLYALVMDNAGSALKHATKAQELLAWSIQPHPCKPEPSGCGKNLQGDVEGEELVAAEGLPSDSPLESTGGLVSDEAQLDAGITPLYDPQGIAVDPLEEAGVENPVAIEATDLLSPSLASGGLDGQFKQGGGQNFNSSDASEYEQFGDTIVQSVATGAGNAGALLKRWSAGADPVVKGVLGEAALTTGGGPLGIFEDAEKDAHGKGYLSVLLHGDFVYSQAVNTYVVRLNAELEEPLVLNSDAGDPGEERANEASVALDPGPFFTDPATSHESISGRAPDYELRNAGPEVAQLSASKAGPPLYAADVRFEVAPGEAGEEVSPWRSYDEPQLRVFPSAQGVDVGVRLLRPQASGSISGAEGETIVNTLGAEPPTGSESAPCGINAEEAALAAGSEGTLWVLDRGPIGSVAAALEEVEGHKPIENGRKVIELAPGAGSATTECPQPSGTFRMGVGEASQSGEVTVSPEEEVLFDASSINRQHGTPFKYEWEFGDGSPPLKQTAPGKTFGKAGHTYAKSGTYEVKLRLQSDYGVYEQAGTVKAETAAKIEPRAEFTVAPGEGAQEFSFDASASIPGTGRTIDHYIWSWSEGGPPEEDDASHPVVTHAFASSGPHTVTLTIVTRTIGKGENERTSSLPQTVIVSAPEPVLGEELGLALNVTNPPSEQPPGSGGPGPGATMARGPTYVEPHASFSKGTVNVRISCPPAKARCAGTVQVETVAAFSASAASAKGRRAKARASRLIVAQASFGVPAGASRTVGARLTAKGAALLKRLRHLPVLVLVTARDPLGDPGLSTLHLTLLTARAARSKA
jgi:PKD repeat protein